MKIIELKSQNFKRLKAVEIRPHGNTVVVSGKNGQGKSSILDSILVAFAGKQSDLIKPIRDGEYKADINIETEQYFIHRTFKQGTTKLEITSKDGEIISSPQGFLDKVIGQLSFDPLAFQNLPEKKQRDLLLSLAKINLDHYTKERQHLYAERHDIGVLRDSLSVPQFDEIAQAEAVVSQGKKDSFLAINELQEAQQQHETYVRAQAEQLKLQETIDRLENQMFLLRSQIVDFRLQQRQLNDVTDTTVDIPAAQLKIASIGDHNSTVDAAALVLEQVAKRKKLDAEYTQYTSKIESLDAQKEQELLSVKMPIEGLSVSDDGVLFNKIPFSQLSSAEKLKVSMSIAMASNPELRVIRIMDGSLLDEDNLKVVSQMAGEKDFQVWIETCHNPKDGVFIEIEDGEVVADNQ